MFKNRKIKRLGLKLALVTGIVGTISAPIALMSTTNTSFVQSENNKQENQSVNQSNQIYMDLSSISRQDSETSTTNGTGYTLVPIGTTGISLKVPDFSSNKDKANLIANTYATTPGNINTDIPSGTPSVNNIYNILEFDSKWVQPNGESSKRPVILNLGYKNTYLNNYLNSKDTSNQWKQFGADELTSKVSLPAFDKTNDSEQPITQDYLNQIGVLALQITLTSSSSGNTETTYYVLVSGFGTKLDKNSGSDSPMLPGDEYVKSVKDVTSTSLLNNINFQPELKGMVKSIVQGSRVNNVASGSLSFTANFRWTIPYYVKFNDGFQGVISAAKANSLGTSDSKTQESLPYKNENSFKQNTSWSKSFTYTGFQPSPDFSTTQIIVTLVAIIGSIVGVSFVCYGITKLTRFVREKNAK